MQNTSDNFQTEIIPPPIEKFDGDNFSLSLPTFKSWKTRQSKVIKSVSISRGESVVFEMQDGSTHEFKKNTFWKVASLSANGESCIQLLPAEKGLFKKMTIYYYDTQKPEEWSEGVYKNKMEEMNVRVGALAAPCRGFINKIADKLTPTLNKYGFFEIFGDLTNPFDLVVDIVSIFLKKKKESSVKWFYVEQQNIQGPYSRSEIIKKIENREIGSDTPVWNSENAGDVWVSLKYTPMRYSIPVQK